MEVRGDLSGRRPQQPSQKGLTRRSGSTQALWDLSRGNFGLGGIATDQIVSQVWYRRECSRSKPGRLGAD